LRLNTDLPVRLYYDFKPGRQPLLAEMLSDQQRKTYNADGSSIRLPVDNRYYEDTPVNRVLLRVLILCYFVILLTLLRWLMGCLFPKPRAVRGLQAKPTPLCNTPCPFIIRGDLPRRHYLINEGSHPLLLCKEDEHVYTFKGDERYVLEPADLEYLVKH
jgi:hypothetical protein